VFDHLIFAGMGIMREDANCKPILAVTPNPVLDLGGTVNRLVADEKNYVHSETRFPGGNAINAARILRRLGSHVVAGGFLGGGVGDEIRELLEAEKVNHFFIPIEGSSRVGVTVTNLSSQHQTRLGFSGPTVSRGEYEKLLEMFRNLSRGTLVIIGGSFPLGMTEKSLSEIVAIVFEKHCECVVDVPGMILRQARFSTSYPLLIKPNLIEFQDFIGEKMGSRERVFDAALTLTHKIPLVCVSSIDGGAILVTPHGSWFGRIPDIEVKTSVGAGDSMVGAMCAILSKWKFATRHDPRFVDCLKTEGDMLLRWGLAASCATLIVHGTQLGSKEDILRFLPEIKVEKIH
jgi:1-phosphofructokinase family hexose kinase